jgi:phosphonate transport system ATP-binding protein
VIFADEPVSAVEPASAERIMQDFKSICDKDHVTVICTMHKIELAEKYASRIIGIAGGRIVLDIAGRHLTQRERNLIS